MAHKAQKSLERPLLLAQPSVVCGAADELASPAFTCAGSAFFLRDLGMPTLPLLMRGIVQRLRCTFRNK